MHIRNRNIENSSTSLLDYLFWIILIIFTDPGGILEAFGEDSGDGGINVTDLLFGGLLCCYVLTLFRKNTRTDIQYTKIFRLFLVFLAYYFIVFGYIVPELKSPVGYSLTFVAIKSRHTIYSVLLFIMVYRFFKRSYLLFFKILLVSSFIVIILFLITFVTGIDILPLMKTSRGFIKIDRIFLFSYGLMPLLIPMGAIILTFKIDISWKRFIIVCFGLMFLTWLLSLTRRHILGTIIYLIFSLMMYNHFRGKVLLPLGKVLRIFSYSIIILFLVGLSFPKYVDAGQKAIEQAIYVAEHGETTTGRQDNRLGLGKNFMQKLIEKNYVYGTGFDNRWRTAEGDKEGYEAADYPFLAAIAMFGIMGMLVFLPVYIVLIKTLKRDYSFIKKNNINYNSFEFFALILFVLFFSYDLLQYVNWFKPLSRSTDHDWYIYLAMYLSIRHKFYNNYITK